MSSLLKVLLLVALGLGAYVGAFVLTLTLLVILPASIGGLWLVPVTSVGGGMAAGYLFARTQR